AMLIVRGHSILRNARAQPMKPFRAQFGKKSHAFSGTGRKRIDGKLVAGRIAIDTEADADVAGFLFSVVADARFEAQRLADRAQAARQTQFTDAEVFFLMFI